ncbi:MAG: hypothetical protein Kow0077_09320 [Anaerolineae bacterium]
MNSAFWDRLEELVRESRIVIDRPAGTAHPRYPAAIYPLDYGYLAGTTAADRDGIDVWVGSLPGTQVVGVICTVDATQRDAEIKVLVGCTPQEAERALAWHNRGGQGGLLVWRYAGGVSTEDGG